jgi:hypothetical protein
MANCNNNKKRRFGELHGFDDNGFAVDADAPGQIVTIDSWVKAPQSPTILAGCSVGSQVLISNGVENLTVRCIVVDKNNNKESGMILGRVMAVKHSHHPCKDGVNRDHTIYHKGDMVQFERHNVLNSI